VTYLVVLGQRVGLRGIEGLFSRWESEGREPEDLRDVEILSALRERNYLSDAAAPAYAEAARGAYAGRFRRSTHPAGPTYPAAPSRSGEEGDDAQG